MRSKFVFEGIKEELFCLINHNVYFCNKWLHISYKTVHLKLRNTAYKCENMNTTLLALSTWSTICFSPVYGSKLSGRLLSVEGFVCSYRFPPKCLRYLLTEWLSISTNTHIKTPTHTLVSNKAQKGPGLNSAFYLLITASRLHHNLQKTWGTL